MLELFFTEKIQQLVFYASRYLRGQMTHAEIHLFIWDTLEEWSQFKIHNHTPANQQEQVFWHLLHQIECWSETEVRRNRVLRKKLQYCVGFLQGKAEVPFDCIGIRP